MADVYGGPFGTYANVTGVVNATAASEIVTLFTTLKTFLPVPSETAEDGSVASSPHPDFDKIDPDLRDKLLGEINAVQAAIAAAPTA